MIPIEECKKILEDKNTESYSNEEVKQIREYLYKMANIAYNSFQLKENDKEEGRT